MKLLFCITIGFGIGVAFAYFEKHRGAGANSLSAPSIVETAKVVVASARPPFSRPAQGKGPTLRATIEPVYQALFGSLDDSKAFAVAMEESAAMEPLLAGAPRDHLGESARRVGSLMKGVLLETQRARKAQEQPSSNALGGGGAAAGFFGGIYEKRWRASVAALAKKAGPEWRRLIALDAAAAYPPEFQSAMVKLLAERHIRHLERTATVIVGTITESADNGSMVRVGEDGDSVFVEGLPAAADGAAVRVLAHSDGVFKFTNSQREKKTVWKFRYYRNAQ